MRDIYTGCYGKEANGNLDKEGHDLLTQAKAVKHEIEDIAE